MSHDAAGFMLVIIIGILVIVPAVLGARLAIGRGRNPAKAFICVVACGILMLSWPALLLLWLGLKRRGTRPDGTFYLY